MAIIIAMTLLAICSNSIQTQFQSCASEGAIGPCLSGLCPLSTASCITTSSGDNVCCELTKIINHTTATPSDTITDRHVAL
ncbi:hypothetical protein DICVIV_13664 [Dictyocaulus viviparus]|uniref:CC domain-containing protein n=1 Tax=Dictyocaulus viviparus TaxID=29172 RepID=A0A0D8X770_DICVI|nr:hypothetical protein DICVIV_13664 [Dictyocaulus viviparus]